MMSTLVAVAQLLFVCSVCCEGLIPLILPPLVSAWLSIDYDMLICLTTFAWDLKEFWRSKYCW